MIDYSKYITWEELTVFVYENLGIKYTRENVHSEHYGLSLDGKLPYSISEYEFNYMKDFIIKHNLKSGYELATGTCLSTIAIGIGLKQTGGKLISLDSYIEYLSQSVPVNMSSGEDLSTCELYQNNKKLIQLFELDNVSLEVGWSPETSRILLSNNVDFVFLDCPKTVQDFERDIQPILPRLDDKFAIFVHDVFAYPPEQFNKKCLEIFNIRPKYITNFYNKYNQTFPLTLITNTND